MRIDQMWRICGKTHGPCLGRHLQMCAWAAVCSHLPTLHDYGWWGCVGAVQGAWWHRGDIMTSPYQGTSELVLALGLIIYYLQNIWLWMYGLLNGLLCVSCILCVRLRWRFWFHDKQPQNVRVQVVLLIKKKAASNNINSPEIPRR